MKKHVSLFRKGNIKFETEQDENLYTFLKDNIRKKWEEISNADDNVKCVVKFTNNSVMFMCNNLCIDKYYIDRIYETQHKL